MSTTGKIKTLFSDAEKTEALFPRTKTSAVSNEDGRGLDAILADKANKSEIPSKLANPNALTINGQVYDGSKPVSVNITAEGGEIIDTNTTYSLSKSGSMITLTGSDGSTSTVADANTTYGEASQSAAGLLSANDKKKLDGIATGANNYTLPTASSSALGGVKVGNNITNSNGTISLTKANVVAALGYTPPTTDTNTTYNPATTSVNGLMSAADKAKLDSFNNYCIAAGTTNGGITSSMWSGQKVYTYHWYKYANGWAEIYGVSEEVSLTFNQWNDVFWETPQIQFYWKPANDNPTTGNAPWPFTFSVRPQGTISFMGRDEGFAWTEGQHFTTDGPGTTYFLRGGAAGNPIPGYIAIHAYGWYAQ